MFRVKDREYLFGRDIGLAVGIHSGQPAEDAGLGGGLEVGGGSRVRKINRTIEMGSNPIYSI
jgi:hypothetical protein